MQDEINCSIHIPIIRVMIYLVYEKKDLIAETDSIDFVKKLVKKNPDCRVKEATTDKILESTMPIRLLNNWKSRRDFGEYCPYQSAPRPSATIPHFSNLDSFSLRSMGYAALNVRVVRQPDRHGINYPSLWW
ncbi:hypothetical protein ES703_28098 [subsurface metagenome]